MSDKHTCGNCVGLDRSRRNDVVFNDSDFEQPKFWCNRHDIWTKEIDFCPRDRNVEWSYFRLI